MKTCVLAFLAFFCAASFALSIAEQQFQAYLQTFGKSYDDPQEYARRLNNFKMSLKRIEAEQEAFPSASFGLNQFSDMSREEFAASRLMEKTPSAGLATSCLARGVTAEHMDVSAIPSSWDWRTKGVVTPVKDQGSCGSCWAFSTTGVIESHWAIKTKELVPLSEQLIVDCSHGCSNEPPYGPVCNQGCNGGWQWNAYFDIMGWKGLETETQYPYRAVTGQCHLDESKVRSPITNYTCITTPQGAPADEDQMAAHLVNNGPLAIALNADPLMDYSGGIINPSQSSCSGKQLDHALLIVGYDTTGSIPFWIVKNSWGTSWGESGYFRIVKGKGACGLNNAVSSVVM